GLITKKLGGVRDKDAPIERRLRALVYALKQRLAHEFSERNAELVDKKIFKIVKEFTTSEEFVNNFGPISCVEGENQRMYDYLSSLVAASQEYSEEQREDIMEKAQAFLDEGELNEARDLFDSILVANPDNQAIRLNIGERYLNKELYEDAEIVFRDAQILDPDSMHIFNRLGIAFRKMGRYEDALNEYLRAIEVAPNDPHLQFNAAVAACYMKDFAKGKEFIKTALEIKPDFPEAQKLLAQVEKKMSKG
ncbi:MAG: tetratricopeptide repeat protein, partial [Deltaproteobacteria bacterium]|nr:tetratricopeptide repeat protein [Deltaproteobacteria bacterium]